MVLRTMNCSSGGVHEGFAVLRTVTAVLVVVPRTMNCSAGGGHEVFAVLRTMTGSASRLSGTRHSKWKLDRLERKLKGIDGNR